MEDSESGSGSETDNTTFVPKFINKFQSKVRKDDNIVSSPLSTEMVLAMLHQGTGGETAANLTNILDVADKKTSAKKFKTLLETLNSLQDVTLDMANKIFIMEGFILKNPFKCVLQHSFMSRSDILNFADSEKAAGEINQWVEHQTHDKIKDLINESMLNSMTRLVLVNALYFKGLWKNQFKPEDTSTEPFFVSSDETIDCEMMFISDDFNSSFSRKLDARLIELPYKNDNISMLIILPNDYDGIDKLENDLANVDITKLMEKSYVDQIEFSMPKFKIESSIDVKPILEEMGLAEIFDPFVADFSEICENSKGLCVSDFVQKVFIEVNEQGTEAAAATGCGMMMLSGPTRLVVDHPFVFVLQARKENSTTVLFMGKVLRPSY